MKIANGGQLTIAAWRAWLQGNSDSVKRIMRLKNERLADDELFDVVDQMRNDHGRFGISVRTLVMTIALRLEPTFHCVLENRLCLSRTEGVGLQ